MQFLKALIIYEKIMIYICVLYYLKGFNAARGYK